MQEITEIYHTRSRTFRVLNKSTLMQLAEHTYAYVTFAHCFPSRNLNLQSLIRDCNLRLLSNETKGAKKTYLLIIAKFNSIITRNNGKFPNK